MSNDSTHYYADVGYIEIIRNIGRHMSNEPTYNSGNVGQGAFIRHKEGNMSNKSTLIKVMTPIILKHSQ